MKPFNKSKDMNTQPDNPGQRGALGDPGQCGPLGNGQYCTLDNRCKKCLKSGYTSKIYTKL